MAIDGWVAKTRRPYSCEVIDVMAYRSRHDCWGIIVLAGCEYEEMAKLSSESRITKKTKLLC